MMLVLPALLLGCSPAVEGRPDAAGAGQQLRPGRPDDARDLPVRRDVPGHEHRDAEGAHLGHARAAAHHSLARLDLLLGYGLAFVLVAALQAVVTVTVATTVYDLDVAGSIWLVVLIAVVDAVLGVALGLLASAFARSEFQAGAVHAGDRAAAVLPLRAAGRPRADGRWLQAISDVLPLTYAVEALQEVGRSAAATGILWLDVAIVAGAALVALALAAATLRRRTN